MLWENLREEEFADAVKRSGGVCIITIGCMEKHGQHMPLGTDTFIAESVVDAAAEIEDVVVLHTGPWFGEVSCFHADKEPEAAKRLGNIAIKQETLLKVLEELCDECGRNGFKKVLLLNAHGGNQNMLKHFLRMQSYEDKPYTTLFAQTNVGLDRLEAWEILEEVEKRPEEFSFLTEEDIETLKGWCPKGYGGGHADVREVALVMADHPELIAEDRYEVDETPKEARGRGREYKMLGIEFVNSWYSGMPTCYGAARPYGTTRTIGLAMKMLCVERLVKIIKLLKCDDDCIAISRMDRK